MKQKIFVVRQDTQTIVYVFYRRIIQVFKNLLFYICKIFDKKYSNGHFDHFSGSSVKLLSKCVIWWCLEEIKGR